MDCTSGCPTSRGVWSVPEHERFIEAMSLYPRGPWKLITDHVGTRSIKQVQTHAQKYQQKLLRQQRGLRKRKVNVKRPEHRVDPTTLDQFTHKCIVRYAQRLGKEQERHEHGNDDGHHSMPLRPKMTPEPAPSDVSASASSSALSSPTSAGGSLDTSLVGATLGEWLAMTKDAAADAKLLELLPEIFPSNGEDDDVLGLTKPQTQEWSTQQLDALLHPPVASHAIKPETSALLLDQSNAPAPSA